MYLWPFGIFSDIFAAFGLIVGGIIAIILSLLIIACYAVVGAIALILSFGVLYGIYYWIRVLYYKIIGKEPSPEKVLLWIERIGERLEEYNTRIQINR